jgi:hypothetical protein
MQEPMKPIPAREMHKYVLGFVGLFFLIAASYPIAFWRVSQHEKFAGFYVKSFTDAGESKQLTNAAVAVQPPTNHSSGQTAIDSSPSVAVQPANPPGQIPTSNSTLVAVQPANLAETMASNSHTNAVAQPEKIIDANQSTAIANPTIDNNYSQQIVSNGSQVALLPTDPAQLRALNQKVYDQIAKDWQRVRRFKQHLVYRVGVTASGAIASLKPVNQPASDSLPQTPLPNLLKSSVTNLTQESLAEFRVEFTRQGILEVSPWHGFRR